MAAPALVGLLFLASPALGNSHRHHRSCDGRRYVSERYRDHGRTVERTRAYQTVLETRRVRVYDDGSPNHHDFGVTTYACDRATGRAHLLFTNTSGAATVDAFIGDIHLHGTIVAYDVVSDGPAITDRFEAYDVHRRRILHDARAPGGDAGPGDPSDPAPGPRLVLAHSGSIAYYAQGALRVAEAKADRVLASAASGGPISRIAINGHTVHWMQGGQPHQAQIA
jgi:hypothetical protein